MLDADDIMLGELEKRNRLFIRFDYQPVLNKLKTHGGRVYPEGKTKEQIDELVQTYGAKWVEMADGEKVLDVPSAGRPIYDDVEYIEIVVPGDKTQAVHRAVSEKDRADYSQQYAAWKAGQDQHAASGTILEQWTGITKAQIEELKYYKVRTVEHLANMPDSNASRMGPGVQGLIRRAKDFLERAKDNSYVDKLRTELDKRDNKIETLERQMQELIAAQKKTAANSNKEPRT